MRRQVRISKNLATPKGKLIRTQCLCKHTEHLVKIQHKSTPLKEIKAKLEYSELKLKETEEKLIKTELRFRALMENMSDAIVLNDEYSNILYQSPSVTKILGYKPNGKNGKRIQDYVHPDRREAFIRQFKELAANPGCPFPFQYRFRHLNGHYVWLEGVATNLLHDPNIKAYVANYRDISKRKEVEENRDLILNRFKQAQQIANLGHWEANFLTQKAVWSDEAFRIYGMEPGSVEPSQDLFLKHVHPDDLERVKALMQYSMETLTSFSLYHRIIRDGGGLRNLYSVGRFEFDESGGPVGLYGICLDITELTEKEKMLARVNGELETLIYRISHDLRGPVASILGLANLAKRDVRDRQAVEFINAIRDETLRQDRMLQNLVKMISIRAEKPVREVINLSKLVNDVLDSLNLVDGFNDIRFTPDIRCNEPVYSDKSLLFDILSQLVRNSICYRNPEQAVSIVTITILKEGEERFVIDVEDNGVGMADEVKPNVFEMFYRGTHRSTGSGLGLYLTKNAVEKLGGTIEFRSEENQGSVFSVSIPACTATVISGV